MIWSVRGKTIDLTKRGVIMGIVNATPDSFSDGGLHANATQAVAHALAMIAEGAEIIDIGGESTRPGAPFVAAETEQERVLPVIRLLREKWDGLISIDTSKSIVAEKALREGADIVNDVSGLREDPAMAELCARTGCGVVVMHMLGNPRTMQQNPAYQDVVREVREFFEERFQSLTRAGINPEALCFDPGIGFGKTAAHNWELIENLGRLGIRNRPLLLGVSRKSFIGSRLGDMDLSHRSWPTVALTAAGRMAGVMIHRVHEVRPNHDALRMSEAILSAPVHAGCTRPAIPQGE
jgi:dihydropteroate synthase